ncbi:helix-turn-helix domain-containing protein [Streptomyces sp. NPDC023998]|uniref:helix-turn-helix domain-containing protein n=1 Tax=Streptomyces sp. NPDC023998 TaxID=3154597 RepID=UPI003411C5FC
MSTQDAQVPEAALHELRARLERGLVDKRLTKTQLARRARLGRTTVQQVFNPSAPVPSAQTVEALAGALGLDTDSLLALRAIANGEVASPSAEGVTTTVPGGMGRPITEWNPHDLEIHPAADPPHPSDGSPTGPTTMPRAVARLPQYVRRPHDDALAKRVDAALEKGRSELVVLVGSSSTGKTRACWEAVQPLAEHGWRLWHPFDPTRAEAVLANLERVAPRTVVWLNEAQHYLSAGAGVGERIAAALRSLLIDTKRRPVLILATLWPEYATAYTTPRQPGQEDPHAQVRELLAGRQITLPDSFDAAATDATKILAAAGDQQLAHALEHARDGRLTQFLAGAPELLYRYETASPPARALLRAAMDARRLDVGLHLPLAFLEHAAVDYLTNDEYDSLPDNWLERALAETSTPLHGNLAPLRRVRPRPTSATVAALQPAYRLADYLEQHGRRQRQWLCPPASFWQAAYDRLTHPDDLAHLATAARIRHRTRWAHRLWRKAADAGHVHALTDWAERRILAGDWEAAERLARQAADAGDTQVLVQLAEMRQEAGDQDSAEAHYRQAADAGDPRALLWLAERREEAGDQDSAEAHYRQAADAGDPRALYPLAEMRERAGDRDGAKALYLQAADALARQARDAGDDGALHWLAEWRADKGDWEGAERLAQWAADAGETITLVRLAERREEAGDRDGAEALYRQAADALDTVARQAADAGDVGRLLWIAQIQEWAGDRDGVEALHRQATDALARWDGDAHGALLLCWYAEWRARTGDWDSAEALYRRAADTGHPRALYRLAEKRLDEGDCEGAERLIRQAADAGDTEALYRLAEKRLDEGDWEEAERLARQVPNVGSTVVMYRLSEWREETGRYDDVIWNRRDASHRPRWWLYLALWVGRCWGRFRSPWFGLHKPGTVGDASVEPDEAAVAKAADQGGPQLVLEVVGASDTSVLVRLAEARERAGDWEGMERLARRAVDVGDTAGEALFFGMWPYGLDPDGTPSKPWAPSTLPPAPL